MFSNLHPKVVGAAISGALVTIVMWVIASTGHALPVEVGAALVTLVSAVVGWFIPSPANPTTPVVVTPTP